jgi:hypothetical protein
MITHIPDGLTCCSCVHALEKCNHLDFKSMRVIGTDKKDGTKTVKCTEFERPEEDDKG